MLFGKKIYFFLDKNICHPLPYKYNFAKASFSVLFFKVLNKNEYRIIAVER